MFTQRDIERIITAPSEHENLEFKLAENQFDTRKLYQYCVALANEGGGLLLLGISDDTPRQVMGTNAFRDLDDIKRNLFQKLKFRVDVHEVFYDGKRVLVFAPPARPRGMAYDYEGAYLMRIGESLEPMSADKLRAIFAEGQPDFLLQVAQADLSYEQVDDLIDINSYFQLMQRPVPSTKAAILESLADERLLKKSGAKWSITNLGALLFAKNLKDFDLLSRKAPRVIIYKGIDKLETIREQQSTKGYAIGFEGLVEFIIHQLPANEVVGQALRTETTMYPAIAIREIVANAIIHQKIDDFGSFVMIEIYSDRIEISNPGAPLIETDRFIDKYNTRNERMTDIMRRLGICEERSSGIDKVISYTEMWQLPAPDFRATDSNTSVVLFAHKDFEEMDTSERVRACYQHACLLRVMNKEMTNQSLRNRFNLPEHKGDVVSIIISAAVKSGKIKPVQTEKQSRRYARYIPYWA